MIKNLPQPTISDEDKFKIQSDTWLNDSHYWIQRSSTVCICEWCGTSMPICSEYSVLCMDNPVIKKLSNKT